ncbi:MAG: phosphotransferase [Verrucomicrobiales bacterium]
MPLDPDSIAALGAAALPARGGAPQLDPILKGGSDRRYFRARFPDGTAAIAMAYTAARPDNLAFADATETLRRFGVRVPAILSHDRDRMLMWCEDCGAADLWACQNAPWPERRDLYGKALREAAKIHRGDPAHAAGEFQPPFDESLYRWEQDYFSEHFGALFCDPPASAPASLGAMAAELAALPRAPVHRDFQSQNVLVPGGEAVLIDYQGLRLGRPEYDVASLLYDPYVPLAEPERTALIGDYCAAAGVAEDEFLQHFWKLAAQRLMQALGAYGNLGVRQGKAAFLAHVRPAVANLRLVCGREPALAPLAAMLRDECLRLPA